MTELHYVGFNGYHQFPHNEDGHPRVVPNWTSAAVNGTLFACTHRFIVLDTNDSLKIFGVVNKLLKNVHEIPKPVEIHALACHDEFLLVSHKTDIWKYNFKDSNWVQLVCTFCNEEEKSLWGDKANKILKFSIQQDLIIILLSNGSVWTLSKDKLKLLYPHDLDEAIDISSGFEHSLILTKSGCVLSFGNGSRGQLGHGDLNPAPEPVQIAALEGLVVTKIATGGWHSCAVTDSGDLYTWGWNNYGQLSAFEDGKEIGLASFPVLVDLDENSEEGIIDVACGARHTIITLENGDLYSTGWNAYKQLGINADCDKVSKFTKCENKSKNLKMMCGPWYTILIGQS